MQLPYVHTDDTYAQAHIHTAHLTVNKIINFNYFVHYFRVLVGFWNIIALNYVHVLHYVYARTIFCKKK